MLQISNLLNLPQKPYYKCASVDTTAHTWTGYEATFANGAWSFAVTITSGLAYGDAYTPVVDGIYDDGCTVSVKKLYDGVVEPVNTIMLMHFDDNISYEGTATGEIEAKQYSMYYGTDHGSIWTPTYAAGKFNKAIERSEDGEEYMLEQLVLPIAGDFLVQDFTIEFWYKTNIGYDNGGLLISTTESRYDKVIGLSFRGPGDNQAVDIYLGNGSSWVVSYGGPPPQPPFWPTSHAWHHVALVRHNDTYTVYIDGAVYGSWDVSSLTTMSSTNKIVLGTLLGSQNTCRWQGLIDELRISSIARYTSAFTPPDEPFTVD